MKPFAPRMLFIVFAVAVFAGCASPGSEETTDMGTTNVASGSSAHVLVVIDDLEPGAAADAEVAVIEADGLGVEPPERLRQDGVGAAAGWVAVDVPDDADPRLHEVVLELRPTTGPDRLLVLGIDVAPATNPLRDGETAMLDLVLRSSDGVLAFTTREDVDAAPVPRTPDYTPPEPAQPTPVQISSQSGLPPDLLASLQASDVGQSGTVAMPDFYGPEQTERSESRDEAVEREIAQQRHAEIPRAQAEQQGLVGPDSQEGDTVQAGGPISYRIERLNETVVRFVMDVSEGDRFTFHEAWPNATEAVHVDEDQVVLRTDPPVAPGERFTWRPEWPGATEITSIDDDVIVLRHTVEVGTEYTSQNAQGQSTAAKVVSINETDILVQEENPHPLGGRTIMIDFTVVERQEAPQQPTGAPGP